MTTTYPTNWTRQGVNPTNWGEIAVAESTVLPGIYNLVAPTLTDQQEYRVALNVNGYTLVTPAPGSSFATSVVDQSTFTASTTAGLIGMGVYQTTPDTLTNNKAAAFAIDLNRNIKVTAATSFAGEDLVAFVLGTIFKPVKSSTYTATLYKDAGTVTKAVVLNTSGNVYSIRFTNANAAVRYLQIHNKATAPAAAETAQEYFVIPAGTATQPAVLTLGVNELAPSIYCSTGIGWAVSTTSTAFTDSATASDHTITIRYM